MSLFKKSEPQLKLLTQPRLVIRIIFNISNPGDTVAIEKKNSLS
jgi:hypothetical protein